MNVPSFLPPVVLGAVVNMVIGMLWYSKFLFGKSWMKLIGKTDKDLKKSKGPIYFVTFLGAIAMSFVLFVLNAFVVAFGFNPYIVIPVIWLGLVAPTTLSDYLFSKRPLKLYFINSLYYLVTMLAISFAFSFFLR